MFCIFGISVLPVHAAETVRVGYYQGDVNFQDGFADRDRKSGYAYEYYQRLATLNGWRYEYVYGTREEVFSKLLSGEVDIVAGIYRTENREKQVLFSKHDMGLEGEARYFVVNNGRGDLLEKLDSAQDKLLAASPEFEVSLRQKYYNQNVRQWTLTEQERAWLAQKGSLNIGYVRNNLPLSDQAEDGTPTGIAGELITVMSAYLCIPLNPVCYDNVELMEEGLHNREIDAAFPVYSDLWVTESKGFCQTDAFISDRAMIVYQGSYRNDLMDKIALSREGVGQRYYLANYYPSAEMVMCGTKEEAFQAIREGRVNSMIGCSSILQSFMAKHTKYQGFNIAYLDTSEEFGIAVDRGDSQLVVILNKAIHQLDDGTVTSAMIRYSNVEPNVTFMDFIRQYAIVVIFVLGSFFAVLLWVYINFRRRTKIFNAEQAKSYTALEAALGAANAASVAKSTFLSSMSHDIRTPLNGIIGMTAIATAHMEDPVRVKDCLEKIMASGRHLLALINEVLDISKIESGAIQLNEEVVDLAGLVDDLIILNRSQADAKHHKMTVHINNVTHEEVLGDSLRLQQIFTNLVGNAIKYTPDGGKIEITLSEKPSGSPRMGCFEFVVKDNGVGMSEDYLPYVFEAFTRAEDMYTAPVQGTGLGMAIARNIARMMDGDITVESALGKGSKFTVTLFLKLADVEYSPCEKFVGLRVLVVDDDPVIGESTCALLSDLGMDGEWILSGREAVDRAEEKYGQGSGYYAVITDLKVADMDGLDIAREIKGRLGDGGPVVILSTYDWSSVESEAVRAGVGGFIGRPLFKSRLSHLFGRLLGNKTQEEAGSGLKELARQNDFTGKRALLAEDNELNAEIAIEILGMAGITVEWAHDGKEALAKMEASAPGYYDCIFMDVQMPVMNGLDATRAIRALPHPDARRIPIFAMTANAFAEDVRAVLDAGMNEHIAKPLNFELLLKILNEYLQD